MLLALEHAGDQDIAQLLVERDDRVHWGRVQRETLGRVARVERLAEQRLEPPPRDDHRAPSANCCMLRTSLSYSNRMSGTPWRVIAIRAGPIPQAKPL